MSKEGETTVGDSCVSELDGVELATGYANGLGNVVVVAGCVTSF